MMFDNCSDLNSNLNLNSNIILIVCDELVGLKYLDESLLKSLNGIQKFKKKCAYFNNHYANSVPCSASRGILYTGKNSNYTKVTDNVQASNPWQNSMVNVNEGLKTFGTYFKSHNPKYIGKIHLLQELDPSNYVRFKPRLATDNFLTDYDFNSYTKMGDFAYSARLAYFNDTMVTEQILPNGTDKNKCDYYDKINNVCMDGAIPYMKSKLSSGEKIVMCCNYDNPHDILYSNIETDVQNLLSVTGQISGSKKDALKTIESVANYNNNFTKFENLKIFNSKSLELDNCMGSLTNVDQLNVGILIQILSKYYYYGINYFNMEQYHQYQNAYYRCLKQVDGELEKLFDFIDSAGLFENSIICLTSDHGDYVCAHGLVQKAAPIYNQGSSVPLFISWQNMPNHYKNNSFDITTSHLNLLPTLMHLGGYSLNYIKSEGLAEPFINSNGFIVDKDYNVVFLFLSIAFGSLLEYNTKRLIDSYDVKIDLAQKGLLRYDYFTIQGFSACSKFNVDNKHINCGYYFSLLHVYVATIKYYDNLQLNFDKNSFLEKVYILQDKNNAAPFALVGNKLLLQFQLYTDPIVKNSFSDPIIIEYVYNKSCYTNYLCEDPIYGSSVLTFSLDEITNFKNTLIDKRLFVKNNEYDNYMIVSSCNNSNVVYVGPYNLLKIILSDDNNIKKLIDNPVIVNFSKLIGYEYINHPIINNISICFNIEHKQKVIHAYSNLNSVNTIFTNIVKSQKYNIVSKFTEGTCVRDLINTTLNMLNSTNTLLRMPGIGLNVYELIENNYQTQLFDNSTDLEEIFNLVDSSRIDKVNPIFIKKCYDKLYENIKANNLDFIYISLPSQLIFSDVNILSF